MDRRSFLAAGLAAAVAGRAATDAKRQPRILLKSSWQTVNIGDIAHTPGMVRLLGEYLPEAEVTLWPNSIGPPEEAMLRANFPKLKFARTADEVKAAFADNDFLLHGSGPSLVAAKGVADWKAKTKKPYGILGITLSAVDDATRPLFDGAGFAYFRDTISLQLAKDKGLKCPVMDFSPDAAFAVNLRDDAKALPYLKANGLEDGQFLVAIPRYRNTPYWLIRKKAMTDIDRAKDATNQKLKEHDHAMVRDALVAFVKETGRKVLVCPEDESHMAIGKEMFIDKLPADVRDKFVWRPNYWITDEAVSVYARSLGLLSMDMHSPIMAIGNGIPAIHCRFKEQTSKGQMWADIGLGDWLFDLDKETDGANITKAVLALAKDPAAARTKAAGAAAFALGKQKDALAVLKKALPA